jgi:hypothetical protein
MLFDMSKNTEDTQHYNSKQLKLSYACVHCGSPCASLYYQLSASLSSIKALTCTNCGELVDPYIEREWLLIVIDCILMRVEAYRHVLFNADEIKAFSMRHLIQFLFAWSMLDAYLKWETQRMMMADNSDALHSSIFVLSLLISSFASVLVEWVAIYFFLSKRNLKKCNNTIDSKNESEALAYKIYLALLLPSTFSVITILVMMWENTKTVRLLGSIMTAYWKALAISTISLDWKAPTIGILARLVTALIFIAVPILPDIPCIGLELNHLESLGLQLCLT